MKRFILGARIANNNHLYLDFFSFLYENLSKYNHKEQTAIYQRQVLQQAHLHSIDVQHLLGKNGLATLLQKEEYKMEPVK